MYDVYFLLPAAASYGGDQEILAHWRALLGQNAIELDDLDAVCETIGMIVGLGEEAVDLVDGLADLADVGSDAAGVVGKALAAVGNRRAITASDSGAGRG